MQELYCRCICLWWAFHDQLLSVVVSCNDLSLHQKEKKNIFLPLSRDISSEVIFSPENEEFSVFKQTPTEVTIRNDGGQSSLISLNKQKELQKKEGKS